MGIPALGIGIGVNLGWALPLDAPPPPPPPPLPEVLAPSAVVMDYDTGQVVYAKGETTQRKQASTTKVMTLLLALEYLAGTDTTVITVSSSAVAVIGTLAQLQATERITWNQLLYGLMLPSGNDAANLIAEYIGQTYLGGTSAADGHTRFVARMNARAAELGLTNTAYVNPHGLDVTGHYTSALDLAVLTRTLFRTQAEALVIASTPEYAGASSPGGPSVAHKWTNTDQLLGRYPGTIAGKTGTTALALQCLAVVHERTGSRVLGTVLGSSDRYMDMTNMFEYAHTLRRTPLSPVQGMSPADHSETVGTWLATGYFPLVYRTGYGIYSNTVGGTCTYRFLGTRVQVIAPTAPSRGRIDLTFDGGAPIMIELYSPTSVMGVVIFDSGVVADGQHTIVMTIRADLHASSSGGTRCALDEFVTYREDGAINWDDLPGNWDDLPGTFDTPLG